MKKAGREARNVPCARRPWNSTPSASPSASLGASAKQGRLFSQSARKGWGTQLRAEDGLTRSRPALHKLPLETDARLQVDNPARECNCTASVESEWGQIQMIKHVENVHPDLQAAALAEKRQRRILAKRHIYRLVPWPTERVAADARRA